MEVHKNQSTMAIQRQSYIGQKKDRGYLQNKVYKYTEQFFFIIKPIIIKNMGQQRIQANLYKRYGKEEAMKRIIAYRKRVTKSFARGIIYLQINAENKTRNQTAYDNRKLVKAGKRESCNQRKRRLRKEYLAKKEE